MNAFALLSPDDHAAGMTTASINPLRYDGHTDDPTEIAGLLRSLMPSGVSVLDVGCGTGSVATIANRGKSNSVSCIEPDTIRAAIARSRGLNVYAGYLDAEYVRANNNYDVVMASDVLEHVASPLSLLKLMVDAARPGGTIIISVPNVAHWSVRVKLLFGNFDLEPEGIMDATHLRWFTEKTARQLIKNSGASLSSVHQTAGLSLGVYHGRYLCQLPGKEFVVRSLSKAFPRLFGVQHVLVARKNG